MKEPDQRSEVRGQVVFFLFLFLSFFIIHHSSLPSAFAEVPKAWIFTLYTPNAVTGVSDYDTGNTTATKQSTSGVSAMARQYGETTSELKGDILTIDISRTAGLFAGRIVDLDPSQAATGTSDFSSGTTAAFWVKTVEKNEPSHWAQADMIPVFLNVAISGASTVPGFFRAMGNYMRAYMQPSGITPFGLARLEIATVDPDKFFDPTSILLGCSTYVINANSGVSVLTVPAGTKRTTVQLAGDDIRYEIDGTNPVSNSSPVLSEPYQLTLDNRTTAENFKFRETSGGSGSSVFVKHYNK